LQKDEERKEQKNSLIRNYYSGRVFGFGQHLGKKKKTFGRTQFSPIPWAKAYQILKAKSQ
jgi:hypothetical protein